MISLTDDVLPSDPEVLTELKSLDVSHNPKLRSLDSFLLQFPKMSNILRLNLRCCNLREIPSSTESGFSYLSSLQALDVSSNKIATLHVDAFKGGLEKTLQLLDVSSNQLNTISGTSIASLISLKTFMFHTNGKGISENSKLLMAEEDGNHLTKVISVFIEIEKGYTTNTMKESLRQSMLQERLSSARKSGILDLSAVMQPTSSTVSNADESMIPNDLLGFTKDLCISHNNFNKFPKELGVMYRLVRLDASHNIFRNKSLSEKKSSPSSLPPMSKLLPAKPIFTALRMLLTLDLSNNQIGPEVPLTLVSMAPKLQVLALYNNDIERMDPSFVTSTWKDTLRTVTLRGNPLPNLVLDGLEARGVPGLFAAIIKVDQDHKEANEKLQEKLLKVRKQEMADQQRQEEERRLKLLAQVSPKK